MPSEQFEFAVEDNPTTYPEAGTAETWKVLMVDDDPDIHSVTRLALAGLEHAGRPLELHSAESAEQAGEMLRHTLYAVALVDVVMESDEAGLDLVRYIRETLGESRTRLIVRTGQPGLAPAWDTVRDYDINGYEEKSFQTATRLKTAVLTALRSFEQICALEKANQRIAAHTEGLRDILDALSDMARNHDLPVAEQRMLSELSRLVVGGQSSVMVQGGSAIVVDGGSDPEHLEVIAASGEFDLANRVGVSALPRSATELMTRCLRERCDWRDSTYYCTYSESATGAPRLFLVNVEAAEREVDRELIQLFCRNASLARDAIALNVDLERSQEDIVLLVSEAIEARSMETGNHVRRVGEYSQLIAQRLGIPEEESKVLRLASPLHDLGKIAIADAILKKPGRLTDEERTEMEKHPEIGAAILSGYERPILQAAKLISLQHQEKWDGTGYPYGLAGDDIHIFAQITAIADVFDAVSCKRCYKPAWSLDRCFAFLKEQRGRHFSPRVVDAFFEAVDDILAVRERLKD
ncbi:HD domain-containing phosphohydrolase [uncultured Abyssibacter sp.]|uniref:HD domain-containing phosphohydrolase n=1 Tax=uncultured Abyssibacter sp. TaxID=2320202 RepID=UPI0032B143E1